MDTFSKLAQLPLTISSYEYQPLEWQVSPEFTRMSTVVRLSGSGFVGLGEDITYEALDHIALQDFGAGFALCGSHTLESFSQRLDEIDLFPTEPVREVSRYYRRWAFESAALDLALRQAGMSLAQALSGSLRPVSFVVSTRLGEPPTLDRVRGWLSLYPDLRFKLDATSSWTDSLIAELVQSGCVASIDLKGLYAGTPVDQAADAQLYERVVRAFGPIWIEDAALNADTLAVLAGYHQYLTWDAPIHSVSDITSLPFRPRMVNIKPSRFGSLRSLLSAYDYCESEGIGAYGGGMFELGPGRGQIQYLAALFHPDAPNDVAPRLYNSTEPVSGLPVSPLDPPDAGAAGFRWGDDLAG
jgi:L-alanine-DL-glutamate epimerase-like enolase superfamily enzyme